MAEYDKLVLSKNVEKQKGGAAVTEQHLEPEYRVGTALPAALRGPLSDLFSRISAIEQQNDSLIPAVRQHLEGVLRDAYQILRTAESLTLAEEYALTEQNSAVFPLWEELLRCMESARALLGNAGRLLEYDFPAEDVVIRGDAHALSTVLLHLVANALTASPEEEPVTVRGQIADHNALITVSDRGHGILPEYQAAVFTPYFSVDAEGLPLQSPGLGLTAARRVMEAHGGSIRILSNENGTAVICSLPLADEEPDITLHSHAPLYREDRFSPIYTVLCTFLPPPWPYRNE